MFKIECYGKDLTNDYIEYSRRPQEEKIKIISNILEKKINEIEVDRETAVAFCLIMIEYCIENLDINYDLIKTIIFKKMEEKKLGKYNDHKVEFNEMVIDYFMKENLFEIAKKNTIAHELVHEKQLEDMKEGKKTLSNYINIISLLAEEETSQKIYSENYRYIYTEVEARNKAFELTQKFILDNIKYANINEETRKKYEKGINFVYNKEVNNYLFTTRKYNIDGNYEVLIKQIMLLAEKYLKKNPEKILEIPILSIQYNEDGSMRSPEELYNVFDSKSKQWQQKYSDLYNFILLSMYDEKNKVKDNIKRIKKMNKILNRS